MLLLTQMMPLQWQIFDDMWMGMYQTIMAYKNAMCWITDHIVVVGKFLESMGNKFWIFEKRFAKDVEKLVNKLQLYQ